ncbi:LpqB family beta-propeller domain-containing protein [Streptomyces himalayensis]|uniref:Lipoprotein LpqB n=1 Tax=Streptomyces himalayensis subsp. himalayensis TaxID=2756131 RepID=A0A7W0DQT3_9ACTN|nr:LpqB family beta-propeller domain-containing protein [Streptomyces himalayensis]MBA2949559.1 GerMN domain-containing protein [Streptomyces himalayensis subsp. himalayensis]
MGAERFGRGRRRPLRAGLVLACSGVLLAGCASMPDSGDVRGVQATQGPDSQVRVFPMPPSADASPVEIVQGFLEALTSDDPQFEVARKYLTAEASKDWNPDSSTVVLADGPTTEVDRGGDEGGGDRTYTLTGQKVARVDAQHAYQPVGGRYREAVHLTKVDGPDGQEWRIDLPPDGVVLGDSDFQRIYEPVDKYYFADSSSDGDGQRELVADPVYVRGQIDPLTQTVKSLLAGPTNWLEPVVRSRFPSRTQLKKGTKSLSPDDQNKLKVPLNRKADHVGRAQCMEMAAQLLFTIDDLTPSGVDEVELQRADGSQLCVLSQAQAETIAPHRTVGRPEYQYFLDEKHRLVRMGGSSSGSGTASELEPVPGPLGNDDQTLRSAAVSRDEERAAGVSLDGRSLFVASLTSGGSLGDPVVTSRAKSESDRLSTPSWDGRGDLWVADRDPKDPRLLLLEKGAGEPIEVGTHDLDGGRIEAVRVAADGVRVALLVKEDGKTSLRIGRIERQDGSGERPEVSVVRPRLAAPQMEVTAMSWAGGSRLVVVGRESGGVQQIRYVKCDGLTPSGGVLPGLNGVKEIAASENDQLPLVANSDDGIVRLPVGAAWQTVVEDGTAPVYPG